MKFFKNFARGLVKKFAHNKKGVVIELAMMIMLVVFTLASLIATTSMIQGRQRISIEKSLANHLEVDPIGESFCGLFEDGVLEESEVNALIARYSAYLIEVNSGATEYVLTVDTIPAVGSDDTAERLLTVVVTNQNSNYTVTQWKYE